MAVNEFRQLDKVSLGEYIKATPCLSSKLGDKLDGMMIEMVAEGLMNCVYIVTSSAGSMVIKQAIPYLRSIGESWPVSKERAKYEAKTLQIYASLCPSHVPELYYFDPSLSLIAMQYLASPHILLRTGLIAGIEFPSLADDITEFFAQVFFHSSRLYTSTTNHKRAARSLRDNKGCDDLMNAVAEFCGNVEMTSLMAQPTFSPFEESKHISWTTPELDLDVRAILEDNIIKFEVAQLKSMFCERTQALIHADFHGGSIMVTENSVKAIDPEYAFYGPMGYDVGVFFRNLIVSFFIQDGLATDQNNRQNYKKWLLKTLEETWNLFEQKFIKLWDEHKDVSDGELQVPQTMHNNNRELRKLLQRKYMEDVFQDALGFCAVYMLRCVIHIFAVEDIKAISNVKKKAACERKILEFGKMLLKERNSFGSITEVVASLEQYLH